MTGRKAKQRGLSASLIAIELLGLVSACQRGLAGAPCPCTEGNECCATKVCQPVGQCPGSLGSNAAAGNGSGATFDGLLVDDFEDGDSAPLIGGSWYGYTDEDQGGLSTLNFTDAVDGAVAMNGSGYQSQKSLEVSFTLEGTSELSPYVGFGASIGIDSALFDFNDYAGIAYTYRGSEHRVQVQVSDVKDSDEFSYSVPASSTWKTVSLPFEIFAQEGWGAKTTFNLGHGKGIGFSIRGSNGVSGQLSIDNLSLMRATRAATPDMTIRLPAPPADVPLDSIRIDNPLQAKAMRYLTRGYNLTDWLEKRFTDFDYDESYVEALYAAGFRSLRLPIDLDLYVASTSGTGDSLSITVSDDLWRVLDAFDTWTRAHGLSLTINYHQSASLTDLADPDSVRTAVLLWGQVAAHFSNDSREDLFFELMNEPEVSFAEPPTQAQWGAIAERMIAAIRAEDSTHSVIFGDVEWYGIDKLASRQPLSDRNVIYAFHDYEPLIFTLQGAGWENMASTHDLPYPYDPSRWSGYYADLGFNASMKPSLLNALENYYRDGNRAALKNHIVTAKRWAVAHDVPVICNEFGAYDATSGLYDRIRYSSDMIDIFEELQIPWQHWFKVMSADGSVIPEYREALRLDQ